MLTCLSFSSRESEARQSGLSEVNAWIQDENEKRRAEAEAIRRRMEREKQELRDYMEKDSKGEKEASFHNRLYCFLDTRRGEGESGRGGGIEAEEGEGVEGEDG